MTVGRVEDMVEVPGGVELCAVAAGRRDGAVFQQHAFGNLARHSWIFNAYPPRLTRWVRTERTRLTHIHQRVLHTAGMQQIHDAISDVALANAIECNGHAGPSEGDAIGCKLERSLADAS